MKFDTVDVGAGLALVGAPAYYLLLRTYRLGKNFTLWEMLQSKSGGLQIPTPLGIAALQRLVTTVLQPLRDRVGVPFVVTSGFRTYLTNILVGGSMSSDHLSGLAVDFIPRGRDLNRVADAAKGLPYDQLIIYPKRGHIHISAAWLAPRRQRWVERG